MDGLFTRSEEDIISTSKAILQKLGEGSLKEGGGSPAISTAEGFINVFGNMSRAARMVALENILRGAEDSEIMALQFCVEEAIEQNERLATEQAEAIITERLFFQKRERRMTAEINNLATRVAHLQTLASSGDSSNFGEFFVLS